MSRVLLTNVKTLTFYAGEVTTARRGRPVSQLSCNGAGCKHYTPDVVQCYNQGGSASDIQWKCEADVPSRLKLGRVQVGCEGWDGPEDPYILKGSCGLDYTLRVVDGDSSSSSTTSTLFWILFLGVAAFILWPWLYSLITSLFPATRPFLPPPPARGGRGGDDGGDAPPPYSSGAPKTAAPPQRGWRPGFWTGTMAGFAANHVMNTNRRRPYDFDRSPFGATRSTGWGGGSDAGSSRRREGSSRDLGPIRASSGFGGTTNR